MVNKDTNVRIVTRDLEVKTVHIGNSSNNSTKPTSSTSKQYENSHIHTRKTDEQSGIF